MVVGEPMSATGETSNAAGESSSHLATLDWWINCHGGIDHVGGRNGAKDFGREAVSRSFERHLDVAEGRLPWHGVRQTDLATRVSSFGGAEVQDPEQAIACSSFPMPNVPAGRPPWSGVQTDVITRVSSSGGAGAQDPQQTLDRASFPTPEGEPSGDVNRLNDNVSGQPAGVYRGEPTRRLYPDVIIVSADTVRPVPYGGRTFFLNSRTFADRFDRGGGLPAFNSNQIGQTQSASGSNVLSVLDTNVLPRAEEELHTLLNQQSALMELEEPLNVNGAISGDGWVNIAGNPNYPPWALKAGLRSSEVLHKRAKFYQSTRPHFTESPSTGSLPSSAGRLRSHSGGAQGDPLPPTATLPSASHNRGISNSSYSGGDGDDGRPIRDADVNDGSVRMDLTYDLLHKVFSFLDDTSLCRAAMVCKQWRVASSHEDFWKILNFEGRHVTHEQVKLLCARYPKATTLNLKGAPCVDELLVRDAMRTLRNLEVLKLSRGFLSEGFFFALSMECSALKQLSIQDALLGNGGAQEIVLRHESMRCLQIYKCRVLRINIRCPQLESLSLKRTGTASAILHCPRLVNLDVSCCHKLSDTGVRAAATSCPLLASLDLSQCSYVSDETLREISTVCTNLRTLDASYCPNISLEGVRMPMLIELKLHGCEGIISSSMTALSTCAMLEDLQLDFCWLLTAISLDLPRLRQISLSSNRKFVELTLRSPALTKLNLNNCPILNRVDITSHSLLSLVLRQQNGLSSMALQCTRLREVDLSECENLTDAVCDVFSDGGGCPKLVSLILDSCEGLNNVRLASSSLHSLSLVGCRNITSLNLVCGYLQQLQLDGCDHLTKASFAPIGLQSLNLGICPHLMTLWIEASQMTSLDLRGCGVLSQAVFHCPSLLSLDASYCSQLGDDCLDETTSSCPAIQSLVLASCPSIGRAGLLALKRLKNLTMLDLSYTFLTDLSPIFEACPGIKVLRLSACKYLSETALDAFHGGNVLPDLRELDLSYGSLGSAALEGVVTLCPHLSHVSLNGCAHVTDTLWTRLASSPPGSITSRSGDTNWDVGMEDASSLFGGQATLGDQSAEMRTPGHEDFGAELVNACSEALAEGEMVPTHGREVVLLHHESAASADQMLREISAELPSVESSQSEVSAVMELKNVRALQSLSCVGCPHINKVVIPRFAACFHLSSLNLSLSVNIREVQLCCANLTSLNLSNCSGLVVLQLDCARLVSLHVQACGIEAEMLESAVQGCDMLETLDVRNCSKVSSASLARMRLVCPGLKRLYSTMLTQGL